MLAAVIILLSVSHIEASTVPSPDPAHTLRNSVEFSPLSPLFRIYGAMWNHEIAPRQELILGAAYTNIHYDFGYTDAWGAIVGYRYFVWKNLHVEDTVWPTWDRFYESSEDKVYPSFDLWNEFRVGYLVDFHVAGHPCYVNLQWPFGFGLYAGNKPQSFKDHEKENRFFYFPPMLFFGVRF